MYLEGTVALLATCFFVGLSLHELLGRPVMFLRWSVLRMFLTIYRFKDGFWQVGDSREQRCLDFVRQKSPKGDPAAVLRAIDEFANDSAFLMNVGDVKGKILDAAVVSSSPKVAMELGAYVGYSAIRIGKNLPAGAMLFSVEFFPANAEIARQMVEHAGLSDRVTVITGSIGDGGNTMEALKKQHGFKKGCLDFCFFDHDKDCYLPDLLTMREWFHKGSVVVGDNILLPGAPEFRAYFQSEEGVKEWDAVEHSTVLEYQTLFKDIVLVATRK